MAYALLDDLQTRWPVVFDVAARKPLAVGIRSTIMAETGGDPRVVSKALKYWTQAKSYQAALTADGAMRHQLDGAPVAPVSEDHQAKAQAALKPRNRECADLSE